MSKPNEAPEAPIVDNPFEALAAALVESGHFDGDPESIVEIEMPGTSATVEISLDWENKDRKPVAVTTVRLDSFAMHYANGRCAAAFLDPQKGDAQKHFDITPSHSADILKKLGLAEGIEEIRRQMETKPANTAKPRKRNKKKAA